MINSKIYIFRKSVFGYITTNASVSNLLFCVCACVSWKENQRPPCCPWNLTKRLLLFAKLCRRIATFHNDGAASPQTSHGTTIATTTTTTTIIQVSPPIDLNRVVVRHRNIVLHRPVKLNIMPNDILVVFRNVVVGLVRVLP